MGKRRLGVLGVLLCLCLLLFSSSLPAAEIGKGVKVTFLGHAAFKLVSPQGVVILVDPFLKNNPKTPAEMKQVDRRSSNPQVLDSIPRHKFEVAQCISRLNA